MHFLDLLLVLMTAAAALFIRPLRKGEPCFGRETTATLRGLAMLAIILHHVLIRLALYSPILTPAGYLATGLFFFISGYGNTLSMNKNGQRSASPRWLWDKLLKIYVPFLVSYILYIVMLALLYPALLPGAGSIALDLATVSVPNQVSWFPKIILLCFLLHWTVRKLFSGAGARNAALLAAVGAYMVIAWKAGLAHYWFKSVLCYPLGCIAAAPSLLSPVFAALKKRRILSFSAFLALFGASLYLRTRILIFEFLSPLLFCMMCYCLTMLFRIKTRVFSWVGENSFPFYLFHVVCLQAFSMLIGTSPYLYTALVLAGSFGLVAAYLFVRGRITAC